MKKDYIAPAMVLMNQDPMQLLAASGVSNPDWDILYGGVDVEGTIEPTAPVMPDLDKYFE